MKQVTSMARLASQLEKMFRALNHDFYDDELETPIITVTPTAHAYAHYTPWCAWQSKDEHKREINISSAYLRRPIEYITASLLREMAHMYNDTVLDIQDTSRSGMYHNKRFKQTAEAHGLICTRTEKYGWSDTSEILTDVLIEWVSTHDEFNEVLICRTSPGLSIVGVGTRSADGSSPVSGVTKTSSTRKYVCPCCGQSIRATKVVNIICGDCLAKMVEA